MVKSIAAFVEDFAHRQIVGALIERVANDLNVTVTVDWRSARRGHGQVIREVREYLRDLRRQGNLPDFIVIATDANCKGLFARSREIPTHDSPVSTVLAIPDPHVERWLLLDGQAFKTVFGEGCQAPDQKCERDRYKQALIRSIFNSGVTPSMGGIEFAGDIVTAMDLKRAAMSDPSLQRFLDDLRLQLKGDLP